MEKKTKIIWATVIIVAVVVVGVVLFFVVFQDEKNKFVGTWVVIENPAGAVTGGTTTFHENGVFTASDGTDLRWDVRDGQLCLEDPFGGMSGPLTVCMEYEFSDNNNRLTLKYEGTVAMILSKT